MSCVTELVPAVINNLACGQTAQRMSPVSALSNTVEAFNHTHRYSHTGWQYSVWVAEYGTIIAQCVITAQCVKMCRAWCSEHKPYINISKYCNQTYWCWIFMRAYFIHTNKGNTSSRIWYKLAPNREQSCVLFGASFWYQKKNLHKKARHTFMKLFWYNSLVPNAWAYVTPIRMKHNMQGTQRVSTPEVTACVLLCKITAYQWCDQVATIIITNRNWNRQYLIRVIVAYAYTHVWKSPS